MVSSGVFAASSLDSRIGDVLEHAFFVRGVALHGFDQIGNQVVPPLQLVLDLRPLRLDRLVLADELVVRAAAERQRRKRQEYHGVRPFCVSYGIVCRTRCSATLRAELQRTTELGSDLLSSQDRVHQSPAAPPPPPPPLPAAESAEAAAEPAAATTAPANPAAAEPPPNGPTPLDHPLQPPRPQRRTPCPRPRPMRLIIRIAKKTSIMMANGSRRVGRRLHLARHRHIRQRDVAALRDSRDDARGARAQAGAVIAGAKRRDHHEPARLAGEPVGDPLFELVTDLDPHLAFLEREHDQQAVVLALVADSLAVILEQLGRRTRGCRRSRRCPGPWRRRRRRRSRP